MYFLTQVPALALLMVQTVAVRQWRSWETHKTTFVGTEMLLLICESLLP